MRFRDIYPFVRYARLLTLDARVSYQPYIPYDARLFYARKGRGTIEAGGQVYDMAEECALIINSGVEYQLKAPADTVEYIAVNFDYTHEHTALSAPIPPDVRTAFKQERQLESVWFEDAEQFNKVLYVTELFRLEKMLTDLERECTRKLIFYETKASGILLEILSECARRTKIHDSPGAKAVTERILTYIHENFLIPLTNKEIGEVFGFHPNYVSSLIKRYTGMPLHQYLNHVRVSYAVDLLDLGTLSVTEVAERCGFSNIYYFSKYFKKIIGVSPNQYRRR